MSLSINNLKKSFGEKIIFEGFSYEFPVVGVYALRGESGVGKTTLLRIILGLDKNYSGSVVGGGFESCSATFQEYRLFGTLSAVDNLLISYSKKDAAAKERAYKLLYELGFSESEANARPDELSGGMKQRVSIARALLGKGDILILDEPTKELDSELCERVCKMIKQEGERRLVIVVTHRDEDLDMMSAKVIQIEQLH